MGVRSVVLGCLTVTAAGFVFVLVSVFVVVDSLVEVVEDRVSCCFSDALVEVSGVGCVEGEFDVCGKDEVYGVTNDVRPDVEGVK